MRSQNGLKCTHLLYTKGCVPSKSHCVQYCMYMYVCESIMLCIVCTMCMMMRCEYMCCTCVLVSWFAKDQSEKCAHISAGSTVH